MIVLDTNLLSELMRPRPESAILDWIDVQRKSRLLVAAVTEAWLRTGVALLPEGARRAHLAALVERTLAQFADRILPFDSAAAKVYADISSTRRRAGRPIATADSQIAAIARSRGARVATRNMKDFELCGLELVNPWVDG